MTEGEVKEESKCCHRKRRSGILPGVILILLGLIFLLDNYGYTVIDIGKLWPIFLIVPGFFIIYNSFDNK